jgi:beta-lactamase class A
MNNRSWGLKGWAVQNRILLLRISAGLIGLLLLVQIFYPGDKMPLFARVDGVDVSGWNKKDVVERLNALSAEQPVTIALGTINDRFDNPKPSQIGLTVSHQTRIDSANYPWYVRIIPTSLVWFGPLQTESAPKYNVNHDKARDYLAGKLGSDCRIPSVDATLKTATDGLLVVPAKAGGTCLMDRAVAAVSSAKPLPNKPATVHISVDVTAPNVGDSDAQKLADTLNAATKNGVVISAAGKSHSVVRKEVLSWLTFKTTGSDLAFDIDSAKAAPYLAKNITPSITKPAGVTKVSTVDFTETSRSEGPTGQTLALDETLADVAQVLSGKKNKAIAAVTTLPARVEYSRSYTKTSTGIAALLKYYDEDNAGVFGVSFAELGGQGLNAQYNGSRQFVTASTYKLFVAFSTLKRVDVGQMNWNDANISNGRNLSTCFDDMIVKSDNACAEALIKKIGANSLNADIKSIGLADTAFSADNNMTTPNDLANYLTQLEKGKLPLKTESRDRLLSAMKRNVYRQGVPAGATGQTADKVGFLWGLLHDAAIVYSPKGTYVLAVMSDGSTWANIADLTRKIEALR